MQNLLETDMKLLILHLSDIHIKTKDDPILTRGYAIASATFPHLPSAAHVFIVISGDIAFSGEENQYNLALLFLSEIRKTISSETNSPINFIITPGNHDCDFSQNSGARKLLIHSIDDPASSPEIDTSIIETCTKIQKNFFQFREKLEQGASAEDDLLWRTTNFTVNGKIITFECLNVSWTSKLKEEPGHLFFPIERYDDKAHATSDLRIVVLHHPLNWFSQSIYRSFRTTIRRLADILITGHEHQGTVGILNDAESSKSAYVEGCILQGTHDLTDSSFNIINIDILNSQFSSSRNHWKGDGYSPAEEGSWSTYHDLPAKIINPFAVSQNFRDILDDPGAFLMHPSKNNITLQDIFVYPDLRRLTGEESQRRSFISSSKLLSPDTTKGGILLQSEEKAGSTSLLYHIYRQYHDRGFIPVLIHGKDLKKITDAEIDSTVKRAFQAQYNKDQYTAFQQTPSSNKLILIDDFDDSPLVSPHAQAELLQKLRKRFGYLVINVSDTFELRELLDSDPLSEIATLDHFVVQPFGYALRSQLIERWFILGSDGTTDEATLISRCDQAERVMDAVMTKSLIPSFPLYLLTLLQSIEAGRSGDFKESALGDYYRFLLTEAFLSNNVSPEKLTEVFQYSAHLAWEFHKQNKRELTELELREFNSRFSSEWHTVDFSSRINVLISARVLYRLGENYAFRYPYVYYYLKGQYLSENLSDPGLRAYVKKCCSHLYVRDYANTILFLAHHTTDEYVVNCIVESLHALFASRSPLTFKGDTASINRLVKDAPNLSYSGEQPSEARKRKRELQDEVDDGSDGLVDKEENSDNLSTVAQMTMLFKTTEILGQVLKNQYSKILRTRKSHILEELFNGPLRALNDFYKFIENNPDQLVAEIEAALQRSNKSSKPEQRKIIARKVVSAIIQIMTFAFFLKAAQSANSDSLSEDIRDIVIKKNTTAFRLIELCIHLDTPKPIPRQMLKNILKEIDSDPLSKRLVQLMVLNRLYMFKTKEGDLQWLSAELKLDIEMQHVITYQGRKQKLIK